jgi:hypothetical protein
MGIIQKQKRRKQMGLDMYINMNVSVYPKKGETIIDTANPTSSFDDFDTDEFNCSNRITFSKNVAYWRKANQIHRWFVENIQDGEDDCKSYEFNFERLQGLYDECKKIVDYLNGKTFVVSDKAQELYPNLEKQFVFDSSILAEMKQKLCYNYSFADDEEFKSLCDELLPTMDGCFFGSTEIDCYYIYDIINTILMIDRIRDMMADMEKKKINAWLEYHASW